VISLVGIGTGIDAVFNDAHKRTLIFQVDFL